MHVQNLCAIFAGIELDGGDFGVGHDNPSFSIRAVGWRNFLAD